MKTFAQQLVLGIGPNAWILRLHLKFSGGGPPYPPLREGIIPSLTHPSVLRTSQKCLYQFLPRLNNIFGYGPVFSAPSVRHLLFIRGRNILIDNTKTGTVRHFRIPDFALSLQHRHVNQTHYVNSIPEKIRREKYKIRNTIYNYTLIWRRGKYMKTLILYHSYRTKTPVADNKQFYQF